MPIFILILLVVGLIIVYYYNDLVRKKHTVSQYLSDIDVQLKKRYDLVLNLMNTVKGYASHEKETFQKVVDARNRAANAQTVETKQVEESKFMRSVTGLIALVESYPELKANTHFLDLQNKLYGLEKDIEVARERYNIAVRENNITVESFPGNQIAGWFNFKKATYWEIESDLERQLQEVNFKEESN